MECPNCPGNDEWYGTMCVGCGWSAQPELDANEFDLESGYRLDELSEQREAEIPSRDDEAGSVDTGKLARNFVGGLIAGFLGL